MNLLSLLRDRLAAALHGLVDDPAPYLEMLKPSREERFGDYQANCAMPLAKVLGKKPRDVAVELVARWQADKSTPTETPEIAGPGFINLRFRNDWLAEAVRHLAGDDRLGVPLASPQRTFVVDYSSPNVAKPMHVGHLRSTIIGDALARLLRFLGHIVVTDNHVGDWGTQFGILIYGYKRFRDDAALAADPVRELARIYIHVRNLIKEAGGGEDEEEAVNPIAEECRQETAKLHAGDPENLRIWQMMMPWCRRELDEIYERLDVRFDHTLGESFYQPMLAGVVKDLLDRGVAEPTKGAIGVFVVEEQPPALIQKRDGAFTYTTTDIATIRYRLEHFRPHVVLYVVDFRQGLHFKNLFEVARRAGFTGVVLEHISFGSVLGEDRRPIKTREGGAVELNDLLDEAVARARKIVNENSPELPEEERQRVAEAVGLGAVKYADLSQNRTSDYVFSWEKMLAMDGNTAAYMQYAYARVKSVFRKGEIDPAGLRIKPPAIVLDSAHERSLALALLRLPEALDAAAGEYKPNAVTSYLWDLANAYSGFYQNCPVLKALTPELRQSRLVLCDVTARIIQHGLHLLGIRTIEQM